MGLGMKVLLNAVPFGYGPVAKIHAIACDLKELGAEVVFAGDGVAYEFFVRENICHCINVDVRTEEGRNEVTKVAKEFDYALTCMYPEFVVAVAGAVKCGYVDSLFWMWDRFVFDRFPELKGVNDYFIQNTFGAGSVGILEEIENPRMVGGIFPSRKRTGVPAVREGICLSFGGVENIYSDPEKIRYPFEMMALLEGSNFFEGQKDEISVYASGRIVSKLERIFGHLNVKFLSAKHSDFMDSLSHSKWVLATPGLTTILEAFSFGTPLFFMPPQNYSQFLILGHLSDEGHPLSLPNWDQIYPEFKLHSSVAEEEAVSSITKIASRFFDDQDRQTKLLPFLRLWKSDPNILKKLEAFERRFSNRVGLDGSKSVALQIVNPKDVVAPDFRKLEKTQ